MDEAMMTKFQERINEIVASAKKKKNVLEYKEIIDAFSEFDLDSDKMDKLYEVLESKGIDILRIAEPDE